MERTPRGTRRRRSAASGLALALALSIAAAAPAGAAPAASRGRPAPRAGALRLLPAGPAEVAAIPRAPGAAATLLNVWATWCVPCRQEFPELLRVSRAYRARGLRLALVSADFDSAAARRFLARRGVDGPAWIKSGGDQAFIDALDRRWTGSLPATFVYDRDGRLVEFWEGRAAAGRFESAVRRALATGSASNPKEDRR